MTISKLKQIKYVAVMTAIIMGLVMGGMIGHIPQAKAQIAPEVAGCSPDFMRALNKKAELEAFRDVTIAQTHIKKPDSVFQLTCYNLMLSVASTVEGQTIAPFTSGVTLSALMGDLIGTPLATYLESNYDHTILGGFPITTGAGAQTAYNHSGSAINQLDPANYACSQMSKVWNQARCVDFDDSDFFYDSPLLLTGFSNDGGGNSVSIGGVLNFEVPGLTRVTSSSIGQESGEHPDVMGNLSPPADALSKEQSGRSFESFGNPPDGGRFRGGLHTTSCGTNLDQSWQQMLDIAFNKVPEDLVNRVRQETTYSFRGLLDPDVAPDYQNGHDEIDEPWLDLVSAGTCGPAVLTGLVYDKNGTPSCAGFCTNPGCRFNAPAANSSGQCPASGNYCQ